MTEASIDVAEMPYPGYLLRRVLQPGEVHKARVVKVLKDGERFVVKDVSGMHGFLRWLYGRRMLDREARALEGLAGSTHVPRLIARMSRDVIVMERIKGKPLHHKKVVRLWMNEALDSLGAAIAEMHARGFVHLDLRQRENILVRTGGHVTLIDFESAFDLSRGFIRRRVLFPMLARIDRHALLKWRYRFARDSLSKRERRRVKSYGRFRRLWKLKRIGRWFRKRFERSTNTG